MVLALKPESKNWRLSCIDTLEGIESESLFDRFH